VTTTFADVTAEREVLRLLKESETRYRLLADNSGDMISQRSTDHRFEYVNRAHTTVLGWAADELLGRCSLDFVHPDDLQRIRGGRIAQIESGKSTGAMTLRVRHKLGHYVWVEGIVDPIKDRAGAVSGYTVFSRDISLRRQLEQELHQSRRMEAMSRMASGVAHGVNNLLTIIRSASELMHHPPSPADRPSPHDPFDELGNAVDRAAALTSQLLAFCRGQHREMKLLAIAPLLRHAFGRLQHLAVSRASLDVCVDASAEEAWIWADENELTQVIVNLVVNALDAAPSMGVVVVHCSTATLQQARSHRFGTIPEGEYATISVKDSGVGMTEEVLEHIFEPFFTTKPQGRGTGLGLSTVWGIVEEAQGAVVVETAPGQGSSFTVFLPRKSAPAASLQPRTSLALATPAVASEPVEPARTKVILLVDDEAAVRRMLASLLERQGYRVLSASSGNEALQMLTTGGAQPDAIVSDVRMPGMTGVELVSQLLAAGIDLPVLFVSGHIDAPIPTDWPATVTRRFLAKPFSSDVLAREMQQLFAAGESQSPAAS
jgi:PAS domain S-box-containing protein